MEITMQDIRPYLTAGRNLEISTASGWEPAVIVKTQVPRRRRRDGFPEILVRYGNGYQQWLGDQSIRLAQ